MDVKIWKLSLSPCCAGIANREVVEGKLNARELLVPDSFSNVANPCPSGLLTILSTLDTSTWGTLGRDLLSCILPLSHTQILGRLTRVQVELLNMHEFPFDRLQSQSELSQTLA